MMSLLNRLTGIHGQLMNSEDPPDTASQVSAKRAKKQRTHKPLSHLCEVIEQDTWDNFVQVM